MEYCDRSEMKGGEGQLEGIEDGYQVWGGTGNIVSEKHRLKARDKRQESIFVKVFIRRDSVSFQS